MYPPDGVTEEWELTTAALGDLYTKLTFYVRDFQLPAVPVLTMADYIVIAVPADLCPWLPNRPAQLAEALSGRAAADGGMVYVSMLVLGRSAVPALVEAPPGAGWSTLGHGDSRWPAAASFDGYEVVPLDLGTQGDRVQIPLLRALPPAAYSIGPAELDFIFCGGLSSGPWSDYMRVEWPPQEPAAEATAAEDLVGEPEGERFPPAPTPAWLKAPPLRPVDGPACAGALNSGRAGPTLLGAPRRKPRLLNCNWIRSKRS